MLTTWAPPRPLTLHNFYVLLSHVAMVCFCYGPTPSSFSLIFVSFKEFYEIKTVNFSGIQTQIVGVQGKYTDHLTPTIIQFLFNRFQTFSLVLYITEWTQSTHCYVGYLQSGLQKLIVTLKTSRVRQISINKNSVTRCWNTK